MPRAKGRYMLHSADCVGDYPLKSSDDLEELLRERDLMLDQAVRRRRTYFVTDREDPEAGAAEWCGDCPRGRWRGTFGNQPCRDCSAVTV